MSIFDNDDERFMREALREAKKAFDEEEIPIGAVIASNGNIIARAHNQTERLHDVTAHAEMMAFTAASEYLGGKYLNNCTLYVTVEPCPMCAGAAGWTQIGRIVYGADDPKHGFSLLQGPILHPKTEITKSVLHHECKELMRLFFKARRN